MHYLPGETHEAIPCELEARQVMSVVVDVSVPQYEHKVVPA
jgi:hypothetical protein